MGFPTKKWKILFPLAFMVFMCGSCRYVASSFDGQQPIELPSNWKELAYEAIAGEYQQAEPKMLFLGRPRPSRVLYRYWTYRHYDGLAGLAVLKGKGSSLITGESGLWFVIYVIGADFEISFLTDNLESTDVDPPLYVLGVVDETNTGTWRLPRPTNLDGQTKAKFQQFIAAPLKDLKDFE
ncbi:MAG: hypothetical protein LBT62_02630 [Deltaproteobacteria bacterium]|jgi:hypothetical protein|nr:hypothetical protein [Deltaproteobacteria bacterium]